MKQPKISVPIGLKIFGIAVLLLILLTVVAYYSHQQLRQLEREMSYLAEYIIPISNRVDEVDTQALTQEVHLERILKLYAETPVDLVEIAQERQQFAARNQQVDQEIAAAIALIQEAVLQTELQTTREEFAWVAPTLTRIAD